MRSIHVVSALLMMQLAVTLEAQEQRKQNSDRWESAIRKFEEQDKLAPPKKQSALFVGSSSIRKWDLKKSFPNLPTINRGFGGSQVSDSVYFADRIIIKHEPRVVVVYAGDNDIAGGKSPAQVRDDFQALVTKIHQQLSKTKIVYIAIKPSISRWKLVEDMRLANGMIREITETSELLEFVDVDRPMIGDDKMPRPELFIKDGLHLSDKGYKLWASLVMPYLDP